MRGEGEALPQGVEFAAQAEPETDRGAAAPANWICARLRGHRAWIPLQLEVLVASESRAAGPAGACPRSMDTSGP